MRLSHLALAILVCFAWGLNAVAAKVGVTYIPPVFFTALRYIVVLVCFLPWLKPVPGKWDAFRADLHRREALGRLDDVDRESNLCADLGIARDDLAR